MSLQAEQEVIAAMVQHPYLAKECDLTPDEFQSDGLQDVYRVMQHLVAQNKSFDALTLTDELSKGIHGIAAAERLGQLVESSVGSKSMFRDYCSIIRKDFRLKQAAGIAQSLLYAIQEDKDLSATDAAISQLMQLGTVGRKYEWTMREALHNAVKMVDAAFNADGLVGVDTGIGPLNDLTGGWHPTDLIIVGARPAMGKAQPLTSKVLMANGLFKQMADIRLGDQVASPDGRHSVVEGVYPQGVRPIYAITLSDGRVVECDLEHLWTIESSKFSGRKTVTTARLMKMLERERYQNRIRIVGHSGDFGSTEAQAIDPWLLGFLIGDGCLSGSSVRFSTGERFILDKVKSRLPAGCAVKSIGNYDYRIISESRSNPVLDALRVYGVNTHSYSKVIPDSLMTAGRQVRLELLLGLIESDGWSQSGSLQFSSSSKRLAEQVQALTHSLGGCASIRHKQNVTYVANGETFPARDAHICSICFEGMTALIESERVRKNLGIRRKTSQPIIRSINYDRDDLAQCIKVSHPDSLYITDGYVVTHNTALMLNFAHAADKPAGIVSSEQGNEQIGIRMLSMQGQINATTLRTAKLQEDEWPKLTAAHHALKDRQIYINDEPSINIIGLARQAREWKYRYDIGALFVDYVQRIKGSTKGQNKLEQVTEVVGALKSLAKELNIPVIALAQVNRSVDSRPDKRPNMGDLSDASEIEKEADSIIMLYRDEVYNEDTNSKGIAELIFEKNRHGPTGTVRCMFQGQYMRFRELAPQSYQEQHGGVA